MNHAEAIDAAVAALDAIDGAGGERAHVQADEILLSVVPTEVREAYWRVAERAERDGFWAYA